LFNKEFDGQDGLINGYLSW